MSILLDQPLSEIVSNNFKTAHVFEQHGLDFCCKGRQTLQDACRSRGLNADLVVAQLNDQTKEENSPIDLEHSSLSDLTDYIVNVHHDFIRQSVPLILTHILKIATKHGDRFPYMKKVYILFTQINTELVYHMRKEEEIIFPAIRALEVHTYQNSHPKFTNQPLHEAEEEHELVGTLMKQIRALTNEYETPEKVCPTFRLTMNLLRHFEADLHRHIHLENNVLFPRARAMDKSKMRGSDPRQN
jgi:regulator of cell morphogenesis and NO signaling